jgi:hypothetical protein
LTQSEIKIKPPHQARNGLTPFIGNLSARLSLLLVSGPTRRGISIAAQQLVWQISLVRIENLNFLKMWTFGLHFFKDLLISQNRDGQPTVQFYRKHDKNAYLSTGTQKQALLRCVRL